MKLTEQQWGSVLEVTGIGHNNKYLYAVCPFCGHAEFYILFKEENQPNGCSRQNKCGWRGNVYTLLKALNKTKEFFTERQVSAWEKVAFKLEPEKPEAIIIDLPEITPPTLWRRVYADPYLLSRGITPEQHHKFEIGRSILKKNYVTFLVRQEGRLTGYISRSCQSKGWIDEQKEKGIIHLRYDNSESDFSKMLFGLDEVAPGETDTVILVEGIFSKTKTDVNLCLDDDVRLKCLATFGAKFSVHQMELLKRRGVKNLLFWFEADVLNKIKPILANASGIFNVKASYLNGIDPNDIDSDAAIALFERAEDYLSFNMGHVQFKLK